MQWTMYPKVGLNYGSSSSHPARRTKQLKTENYAAKVRVAITAAK